MQQTATRATLRPSARSPCGGRRAVLRAPAFVVRTYASGAGLNSAGNVPRRLCRRRRRRRRQQIPYEQCWEVQFRARHLGDLGHVEYFTSSAHHSCVKRLLLLAWLLLVGWAPLRIPGLATALRCGQPSLWSLFYRQLYIYCGGTFQKDCTREASIT